MRSSLITLLLLFAQFSLFAQRKVDLGKAIETGLVKAHIFGAYDYLEGGLPDGLTSGYTGKCMVLELESLVDESLKVTLQPGRMLMCADTNTQDMVVTRALQHVVPPHATERTMAYAMCSEMHDRGPNTLTFYSIGKMAPQSLRSIVRVIQQKGAQNVAGQSAVWAYTDRASRSDLRYHGATAATLKTTIAILNEAGVYTALNPKPAPSQAIETVAIVDSTPIPAAARTSYVQAPAVGTPMPWDGWMIVCGGLFVSSGVALVLVLRRKREVETA